MKVSLEGVNKTIWIVVLIGVLVGTFSPLIFFNLNHSLAVYVMYPIVALFIGTLGYILVRKHWAGPIITLVGGFISALVFSNLSPWTWIVVYAIFSLVGAFLGAGIENLKYKKTKITLKVLIRIGGILLAMISLIYFSFFLAMTPDKSEEKKVITQAEQYLETEYPSGKYKIYDVLYDNMGNFDQFEYAAKVRNLANGEEFLVYYNDQSKQMEDSLKYADEFYER